MQDSEEQTIEEFINRQGGTKAIIERDERKEDNDNKWHDMTVMKFTRRNMGKRCTGTTRNPKNITKSSEPKWKIRFVASREILFFLSLITDKAKTDQMYKGPRQPIA